jgi:hypothetical protein
MWLSCHTQEEIAEAAQCAQSVASDVIRKFMGPIPETQNHKAESEDVTDFEIPLIGIGDTSISDREFERRITSRSSLDLIGPVLDLGQAITGFPDQFFDACDRLLISYELAEGPIALQSACSFCRSSIPRPPRFISLSSSHALQQMAELQVAPDSPSRPFFKTG